MKGLIALTLAICVLLSTSGCGSIRSFMKKENKNTYYAVFQAKDPDENDLDRKMDTARTIMLYNLNTNGFTSATVTREGKDRLRVEIPDVDNPDEVFYSLGTPVTLVIMDSSEKVILAGSNIANLSFETVHGSHVVKITLDKYSAEIFAEDAKELNGQTITILFNGEAISSSNHMSLVMGKECYIQGSFTKAEAQRLAEKLKCCLLPPEMVMVESGSIK